MVDAIWAPVVVGVNVIDVVTTVNIATGVSAVVTDVVHLSFVVTHYRWI